MASETRDESQEKVTRLVGGTDHNSSAQHDVERNPDHALDISHEHHHGHLHHSGAAAREADEGVSYTVGTSDASQNVNPVASPLDNQHHHDHKQEHHLSTPNEKNMYEIAEDKQPGLSPINSLGEGDPRHHTVSRYYRKFKPLVHLFIWMLFTGWWAAGLALHRNDLGWVVPFLIWLAITIRIITFYVPITVVTKPMRIIWENTGVRFGNMIPEKLQVPAGALLVIAVIIVGAFASPETASNTRASRGISLLGLAILIVVLWATSRNRKKIVWRTVIVGMLVQFLIALFVLRTQTGYDIFNFISGLALSLLGYANNGVEFLTRPGLTSDYHWFLIGVIPAIIFFVAFVQLLFYFGLLQWFIKKFAVFFFWSMRVSGAEAVVAAASPFIGQGESAMLIRPFVSHLTKAEIHQIMCSGFATISGSVLIAYIGVFGLNPQVLVSSCVMSIPASLAVSKMRYPEEEETLTAGRVVIPDDEEHRSANALHAFANGAWLGIKIGGMILATLLCIIALLNLVNGLLTWWGNYLNIPQLTLQLMFGYICYPVAFLLGISKRDFSDWTGPGPAPPADIDILLVGRLIAEKIISNEFVAYSSLTTDPLYSILSDRSKLIATYALCGFANIGSLGTQIGVLSQIAPGRSGDVSRLAVSALISGALSTLTSASIAGMLVTNQVPIHSTA